MQTQYIIIGVVLFVIAFIVLTYNKAVALKEAAKNAKEQIDIQLDRRFKVFENLIEIVKKAMDYEKTTLKDVVALRNQALSAEKNGDEVARIAAEEKISQVANGLNVVFEAYPELKANQNAMQLQEEIVSTENKLSFAKQSFNDSVERYTAFKLSFFASMIIRIFPQLNHDFEYWKLTDAKEAQLEEYSVKL